MKVTANTYFSYWPFLHPWFLNPCNKCFPRPNCLHLIETEETIFSEDSVHDSACIFLVDCQLQLCKSPSGFGCFSFPQSHQGPGVQSEATNYSQMPPTTAAAPRCSQLWIHCNWKNARKVLLLLKFSRKSAHRSFWSSNLIFGKVNGLELTHWPLSYVPNRWCTCTGTSFPAM